MSIKTVTCKLRIWGLAILFMVLTCMNAQAELCTNCGYGLFMCAICQETYLLVDDTMIGREPMTLLEPDTSNIVYKTKVMARFAFEEGDDENTILRLFDSPTFAVKNDFDQGIISLLKYKEQDIPCLWLAQDTQYESVIWVYIQLERSGTMVGSYVPLAVIDESYHSTLLEELPWNNSGEEYCLSAKLKEPSTRTPEEFRTGDREFYELFSGPGDQYEFIGGVRCPIGEERDVTCLWLARDTQNEVWVYIEYVEAMALDESKSIDAAYWGYLRLSDIDSSYHQMMLCSLPYERANKELSQHWGAWLFDYKALNNGYSRPRYGLSSPLKLYGGEGKLIAKCGNWYMFEISPALLTSEQGWLNGERFRYWVPEYSLIY